MANGQAYVVADEVFPEKHVPLIRAAPLMAREHEV